MLVMHVHLYTVTITAATREEFFNIYNLSDTYETSAIYVKYEGIRASIDLNKIMYRYFVTLVTNAFFCHGIPSLVSYKNQSSGK